MKITKISAQKKEGRLNLEIDGSFFCSVSAHTLAQLNLYKEKDISESELNSMLEIELENRMYDRSFNLLASRVKSRKQISQYLHELLKKKKGKWFANLNDDINIDSKIENVLQRLEKIGLINDLNYATLFVQSRMSSKPRGRRQIEQELYIKGIDKEIIGKVLDENVSDNSEMIMKVYIKKYKDTPLDLQNSKMVGYLQRKGFDWDDISKLARELNDSEKQ